jgi:transposase
MDRGFYSAENINALYRKHYKFIVAASTSLSYAKGIIKKLGHEIHRFDAFNAKYELYVHSETIAWDYTQARPYKGDVITGDRRMYLHLYFNLDKAAEDEANFNRKMISLHEELLTGKRIPEHEKLYAKYFEVKETPIRGIQITSKQKAMDEASSLYGYMVLLSNEVKDPITALELYRNRDLVEKAFGNIKERLNCKRMLVSSDSSLEGKLFVAFVALIYLAYIKKQMQDKDLFKKYTMHELLDELDIIECFTEPGKAPYVGEVLQKQKLLYLDMEVEAPVNFAALC